MQVIVGFPANDPDSPETHLSVKIDRGSNTTEVFESCLDETIDRHELH